MAARRQRIPSIGLVLGALAALACGIAAPAAAQQDYPNKPVRIIVPYAAGGTTDLLARMVADALRRKFNQPFLVENRTGAGILVGTQVVTRAAPDGYTLLLSTGSTTALAPLLYTNPGYTPEQLAGVAMVGRSPLSLDLPIQSRFNTLADLIAFGKANKDKLNMATQGAGATSHLTAELFRAATGITYTTVHYQGSTPGLNAILASEVDAFFDGVSTSAPHINSGKMKSLGVTSEKRMPNLPNIPTLKEQGFPDVVVYAWYGFFAPAGTPNEIRAMLHKEINAFVDNKEVQDKLYGWGTEPTSMSIAEFEKFYTDEREMWRKVVTPLNIKMD